MLKIIMILELCTKMRVLKAVDLLLAVAEAVGAAYHGSDGQGTACVPVNRSTFDKCLRVVNDGIRLFEQSEPPNGWRWKRATASIVLCSEYATGTADSATSTTLVDATLSDTYDSDDDLNGYYCYVTSGTGDGSWAVVTDYTAETGTVTVADWLDANGNAGGEDPDAGSEFSVTNVEVVAGDPTRYPLPSDFYGAVAGPITYIASSNHANLIKWCDESTIRAAQAVTVNTGYPSMAAVRPAGQRRWELYIDTIPSASSILSFPYERGFDDIQMVTGVASSGSAVTLVDSDFADVYPDDYFVGWTIYIMSGTGEQARGVVTDYTGSTATFTVADWLAADGETASSADPDEGSAYYVEPVDNYHSAGVQFDKAIQSACLATAEMQFDDLQAGYTDKWLYDLRLAHDTDSRSAVRRIDLSGCRPSRIRWVNDVTYE